MTSIQPVSTYTNNLAFDLLAETPTSTLSATKIDGINIELSDADDVVLLNSDNAIIHGGNGNYYVETTGKQNSVLLGQGQNTVHLSGTQGVIAVGDNNNNIRIDGNNVGLYAGNGSNKVRIYGNGCSAVIGNGNNEVGVLGNNTYLNLGTGSNSIGYYGNNTVISTGVKSTIRTIDYAINANQFTDMAATWFSSLRKDSVSETKKTVLSSCSQYECADNSYYAALSASDMKFAESVDMTEMATSKCPKYVVADGHIYVYSSTKKGTNYYYMRGHANDNAYKLIIKSTVKDTVQYPKTECYNMDYLKNYYVDGVMLTTIKYTDEGSGTPILEQTVRDSSNRNNLTTSTSGVKSQEGYKIVDATRRQDSGTTIVTKQFYRIE